MIQVLNKNTSNLQGIYIGRGSPLGNPFFFKSSNHIDAKYKVSNREEALINYEQYLTSSILNGDSLICNELNNLIIKKLKGEDINLICYCSPLPCHGDIIKSYVENQKYCINWFSNMKRMDSPISHKGVNFWTIENFYQAMKSNDINEIKKIALMNPFKAKLYTRNIKIRENWNDIKLEIMKYGIKHKFSEGTKWKKELDKCKTEIIEWNNWNDTYWGKCIFTGKGENNLGKLIENQK